MATQPDRMTPPSFGIKGLPFSGDDGTGEGLNVASFSPALVSAIRSYDGLGQSYSSIYRSQSAVYTVVEFLAWQVSQIGLKVYRRTSDTDREHLQDSEITRIIGSPAPGLTYERFLHRTVADIGVFGNAYWLKQQRGTQRLLVPLPPLAVTPVGGNILAAASYRVTFQQTQSEFPAEEVVHFRRYNPDDPRIGVSPLEPLRRILAEEAAAGAHREGFWRNFARMEGVLTVPTKLSDDAATRLRESWQSKQAGSENAGKTAILEEGMDFRAISVSPKDAEFIAGRKLTLETVARAYNIPLTVLGLTETSTFASAREFHQALYQDTLGPWLRMLEGEIQMAVVPWFTSDPDIYVEFNLAEKLRGSFEEQADAVRAYGGVPIMSVNELRALFNLPRIEDANFDVPVMPANIIYGGAGALGEAPMPELRAAEILELPIKERSQ
jgi:HK97 family phage portal protein